MSYQIFFVIEKALCIGVFIGEGNYLPIKTSLSRNIEIRLDATITNQKKSHFGDIKAFFLMISNIHEEFL